MHIAIAGNIGAGKTTLTEMLASHYNWEPLFEDVLKNPYLDDFWRFDPVNDTWEQMAAFPGGGRGFAYGVAYNDKAYVGFGSDGERALNDLWEYDPSTDTWTELDTCLCPGRTHPALVAANGHIYVGLGGGGGNKNDWWAYNIESGEWEQRADFPSFRRHHPFYFDIDEYAYVGMGHGDNGIYNDLYRYDHLTDSWETLTNLPGEGRVAGTQFSYNGKGYVLSGDGEDHYHMADGEFWEYDPATNDWTQLAPHLGAGSRWAPGNFVIENTLYFMAGLEDGVLQRDMMTYTFETNTSSTAEQNIKSFDVSPNPSNDYLDFIEVNTVDQVKIFTAEGKLMTDYSVNNNRVDLSAFNPGVYFIHIRSNGELLKAKFLKL